jgi:hypothetical protein
MSLISDELQEIWDSIDNAEEEAEQVSFDWQRVAHGRIWTKYGYDLSAMDEDTMSHFEDIVCEHGLLFGLRWLDRKVEQILKDN